jgi:hypothetical protein
MWAAAWELSKVIDPSRGLGVLLGRDLITEDSPRLSIPHPVTSAQ